MAKQGRLPGDYAIDALVLEVDRRKEKSGDPYYSYGKLVADTTREEREAIAEQYRCGTHRRRRGGSTKTVFLETQEEAEAEVLQQMEEEATGE